MEFEEQQEAINEVEDLTPGLHELLREAIAQYQLWIRCADKKDILDRVNKKEPFLAPAFNILRDALHQNLVVTILKMFDLDKRALSFQRIIRILSSSDLVDVIGNGNNVPNAREILARIKSKIAETMEAPEFKAIKVLRDTVIAHKDANAEAHQAKYGDERKVLENAIEAMNDLRLLVEGTAADYERWKELYAGEAGKFWAHIAQS